MQSQDPKVSTLDLSLKTGSGTALPGRTVSFCYRAVGASIWNTITGLTVDVSGRYYDASNFKPEIVMGGNTGSYEFKAIYTPFGGDATDYISSESAICTVTITPHALESTQLQLSITPSTVESSSSLQAATKSTLSVSLTKQGGTGLPSRSFALYYKATGAPDWITLGTLSVDGSGNFVDTNNFYLENIVGGKLGHYQFKAVYTPVGGDTSDYTGCESAIIEAVLAPASKDAATVLISSNHASADFSHSTNITASIDGASLTNGRQFNVNTIKYGSNQPLGTTHLFGANNIYYDVQVLPVTGTVDPDVMVTVYITDSSFTSVNSVAYWTGSTWQTVASIFIAPNTISQSKHQC